MGSFNSGNFYFKVAYNPILGDLKSGIPELTLIPAPVNKHIFLSTKNLNNKCHLHSPSLIPLTKSSYENFGSFSSYSGGGGGGGGSSSLIFNFCLNSC